MAVDSNKLVMVIDDDPAMQEAIHDALLDEGYSVVVASNGDEALKLLQHGRADAVLLDHMMPVLDGASFMAEASKRPELKDLPIILVTADGQAGQKAHDMGLSWWIRKPFRIEELLTTLETAFAA